ncbi:putative response regulator in two-component system with YpdA [Escherichia coli]|uniref:Putative response regulator in two-component system with YpdA n=1 Tax=Escherichia coli TaxID=562 RepID=A0A377K518_ECOLX|nr:putative response regulator in two-component system with YpdA [Escherichia coli]
MVCCWHKTSASSPINRFIVFITAWKEHAVEAFELEAFDYILKPYQESRITGMLQKLEAAWQQQQTSSTPCRDGNA